MSDDVDFEPNDELGEAGAAKARLAKLRAELDEALKKRNEYLEGWQRCKADMINAQKEALESSARASARGQDELIIELIPALDGFDMAMQGGTWQHVDASWRSGIEGIRAHIDSVLKAHRVAIFGAPGDRFDPALHEPLGEAEGGESNTIARVLRRGYRTTERVLRPAQVILFR